MPRDRGRRHSIIRIMRPASWSRRIVTTAWRWRHHVRRGRLIIVVRTVVRVDRRGLIIIHTIRLRLVPLASTLRST
jgi:hypothetical protein